MLLRSIMSRFKRAIAFGLVCISGIVFYSNTSCAETSSSTLRRLAINTSPVVSKEVAAQQNYYQRLTGDDAFSDQSRWDRYYKKHPRYLYGKRPSPFLEAILPTIAPHAVLGTPPLALEVAMGEGRNAVFLAKKGYAVTGIDLSKVALQRAKELAHEQGVRIRTLLGDFNRTRFEENSFDLVMMIHFFDERALLLAKKLVKPGGYLVFENYSLEHLKTERTLNRDELVDVNTLPKLFGDMFVVSGKSKLTGELIQVLAKKNLEPTK